MKTIDIADLVKRVMGVTEVKVKSLRDGYKMPERATKGSAAYDVYVPERVKLQYGRQIIPLGFAVEMPDYLALDNRTRSGYAAKGLIAEQDNGYELRLDAEVTLGLIDSDYRGEVGCILNVRDVRVNNFDIYLTKGQAIAQMKFCFVPQTELIEVAELTDTERAEKGFGEANNEG